MARVTVIGGAGRMGSWFTKFLKSNGYHVIVSDRNIQAGRACARRLGIDFVSDYLVAAKTSDIVILATPTNVSDRILKRLGRELQKGTLLVEISTMKDPLRHTISVLQKQGFPVLSIHPMFGSGTKNLEGRSILVVSKTRHRMATQLLAILRRLGARIVPCSIDKHDILASILIALPHLMSISLIETLRFLRVSMKDINRASGTTFRLHSLVAESIYQEGFVNEISILVGCKSSVLKAYNQQVRSILSIIRTNPEQLSDILNAGRRFVEDDTRFADSYERFNAAVQAALL